MNILFRIRPALLAVLFLFLAHDLRAQGTERALEAFMIFLIAIGGTILMALVILIVFIINRGKVLAIISSVLACIMLAAGFWLSVILRDHSSSEFSFIGNALEIGGIVNLLIVYALRVVFPKKSKESSFKEPVPAQEEQTDAMSYKPVKWLLVLFAVWFFFSLRNAFRFLTTILQWSEYSVIQPMEIFMIVLNFITLLLLVAALLLLMKGKPAGWRLLLFYTLYSLSGQLFFVLRNASLAQSKHLHLSAGFYIAQLLIIAFLGVCIWLLTTAGTRKTYTISQQSFRLTLLFSVCVIAAYILVTNILIPALS